jgi:hypothetical protein
MKVPKFAIAWGLLCALVVAGFIFAGSAGAAPSGLGSAGDIVKNLQGQGYNVMLNGTQSGPLSACAVTGVHNPAGPNAIDAMGRADQFTTVYIDISCPSTNT